MRITARSIKRMDNTRQLDEGVELNKLGEIISIDKVSVYLETAAFELGKGQNFGLERNSLVPWIYLRLILEIVEDVITRDFGVLCYIVQSGPHDCQDRCSSESPGCFPQFGNERNCK